MLRYIRQWMYLVIALCVAGTAFIFKYVDDQQFYTATVAVRYANEGAAEGRTPSGSAIDVNEIYSTRVINAVIDELGLSSSVEYLRRCCTVTEIIPEEETTRKAALLAAGETYSYFPDTYLVTLELDSSRSRAYAARVLDCIIKNYLTIYGEKYVDTTVIPNALSSVSSENDYIDRVRLIDSFVTELVDYNYDCREHAPNFRSTATGYSFDDLYAYFHEIQTTDIPKLYSYVYDNKLTIKKDALLKRYESEIAEKTLQSEIYGKQLTSIQKLIDDYSVKSKESLEYHFQTNATAGEIYGSDNYILKDVYEWKDVTTDTTYDKLIYEYTDMKVALEQLLIEIEESEHYQNIFMGADEVFEANETSDMVDQTIDKLKGQLDAMYDMFASVVGEYNEYRAFTNFQTLTSITTAQGINEKLYIGLAVFLFLFVGCAGAVVLGRICDFGEYMLYVDNKTNLPNRQSCDAEIEHYAGQPLPAGFSCVVLLLTGLLHTQSREDGDTLLLDFGIILKRAARSYGFVGYNGKEQFFAFFENCGYGKAELFISQVQQLMKAYQEKTSTASMGELFAFGIAESDRDAVYDIRQLLRKAIARSQGKEDGNK